MLRLSLEEIDVKHVLLMFPENPGKFFPGVLIDVAEFPYGAGAKEFDEKTFESAIQKKLT